MSDTILEKNYEEPDRPYSQKELDYLRRRSHRRFYLGQVLIEHANCGHFYIAKANGRKEREALETNSKNVGNCSVCWKIVKTPRRLKDKARQLVEDYCNTLYEKPPYWTYGLYELENNFYTWLYNEFNPKRESRRCNQVEEQAI